MGHQWSAVRGRPGELREDVITLLIREFYRSGSIPMAGDQVWSVLPPQFLIVPCVMGCNLTVKQLCRMQTCDALKPGFLWEGLSLKSKLSSWTVFAALSNVVITQQSRVSSATVDFGCQARSSI